MLPHIIIILHLLPDCFWGQWIVFVLGLIPVSTSTDCYNLVFLYVGFGSFQPALHHLFDVWQTTCNDNNISSGTESELWATNHFFLREWKVVCLSWFSIESWGGVHNEIPFFFSRVWKKSLHFVLKRMYFEDIQSCFSSELEFRPSTTDCSLFFWQMVSIEILSPPLLRLELTPLPLKWRTVVDSTGSDMSLKAF